MTVEAPTSPCEILQRLQSELDALSLALRKATDILNRAHESPDTIRRRRNSVKRWNEVYGIAWERRAAHLREHNCAPPAPSDAS